MKNLSAFVFSILVLGFGMVFSVIASAGPHDHHAKHNMVVFGENEVFVSHIVYKVPHNYQVILKVTFDPADKEAYLRVKAENPGDQFIYLLDKMNISAIAEANEISGELFRLSENGEKVVINPRITLSRANFEVIYFDEVPLSLASDPAPANH